MYSKLRKFFGLDLETVQRKAQQKIIESFEDTSWGTIGTVQNKKIYITTQTWAPALWAGMDGQYIKSDEGMIYQIRVVDLQDRSVILDHTTNLKEGTKVYFGDD